MKGSGLFDDVWDAAKEVLPWTVGGSIPGTLPSLAFLAGSGGLDYLGAEKDRKAAEEAMRMNYLMQKEFAQYGIRWRVEDAKAAGLHPLAALGAAGAQASPSYQITSPGDKYRALSGGLQNMGQNLARAASATMSPGERAIKDLQEQVIMKQLKLENRALDSQLTNVGNPTNPPIPDPRQTTIPVGRSAQTTGRPDKAYGSVTDWYFRRTPTGLKVAPSPDVQGILANNAVEMLKWEGQHHINALVNPEIYTPDYREHPLPKDMYWKINRWQNEFQPAQIPEWVLEKYGKNAQGAMKYIKGADRVQFKKR